MNEKSIQVSKSFQTISTLKNWLIERQSENKKNYQWIMLSSFIILLSQKLLKITNDEIQSFLILDAENTDVPMYVKEQQLIRLSVIDTSYWCQVIYQLSHELCHMYIQKANSTTEYLVWFEETLCEAFSYLVLDECSKRWGECELSKINSGYENSIKSYLLNLLNEKPGNELSTCKTIEDLRKINKESEDKRQERALERNIVYYAMQKYITDLPVILTYRNYVLPPDKLLIDFSKWKLTYPTNKLLSEIEKIQPLIS